MKPQHQHDCDSCEYLGTVHGLSAHKFVDFYVCQQGGAGQTIIGCQGAKGK